MSGMKMLGMKKPGMKKLGDEKPGMKVRGWKFRGWSVTQPKKLACSGNMLVNTSRVCYIDYMFSDEVGYPKTQNPGGENPNPKNQTWTRPETRLSKPETRGIFRVT